MRGLGASTRATMMMTRRLEFRGTWPTRISTDEAFLRDVPSRDATRFASLYERHAKAVMSVAFRLVGCREIAADLTQATFLKLWERQREIALASGLRQTPRARCGRARCIRGAPNTRTRLSHSQIRTCTRHHGRCGARDRPRRSAHRTIPASRAVRSSAMSAAGADSARAAYRCRMRV